ncbi:MAG: hypothetical protein KME15_03025 [Drouetiella hepatica Uher 2000/2452]|uniref:Uncharacterized protein n=1 Tax=Drouetiella hepatica Uher 2000/2452 TaxID=904376 RepID=A0A951UKV5_9CYAN|nr:hypothetical protein [Drouetiella hepatica Uher 2000/2452]
MTQLSNSGRLSLDRMCEACSQFCSESPDLRNLGAIQGAIVTFNTFSQRLV